MAYIPQIEQDAILLRNATSKMLSDNCDFDAYANNMVTNGIRNFIVSTIFSEASGLAPYVTFVDVQNIIADILTHVKFNGALGGEGIDFIGSVTNRLQYPLVNPKRFIEMFDYQKELPAFGMHRWETDIYGKSEEMFESYSDDKMYPVLSYDDFPSFAHYVTYATYNGVVPTGVNTVRIEYIKRFIIGRLKSLGNITDELGNKIKCNRNLKTNSKEYYVLPFFTATIPSLMDEKYLNPTDSLYVLTYALAHAFENRQDAFENTADYLSVSYYRMLDII